jgi:DNA adenine methylase
LKDRIDAIAAKSSKITFLCDDGLTFVKEHAPCKNFAFFIDPPYTVAGERLYAHSEIDHEELFKAAASIAGNVIMTYDNSREARSFARQWGFQTRRIRMRTSHHSEKMELLIARDFRWLNRRAVSGRK